MLNQNRIAVISTGNGGQSMAAYFSHLGFDTSLYARESERVDMFPRDHIFTISGIVEATARVGMISHVMADVIRDAELIMVTTPSQYHPIVAEQMASCLEDGQIIILNPGRTFGTYVFQKTLKDHGCQAKVLLAEAETFVFACRCARIARPCIYSIKEHVHVAAHNPDDTEKACQAMSRLFPDIIEMAPSVFDTGFSNLGMIFHPLPILLNITRIEAQERFLYYKEGITPLVANILDRLDRERIAVAKAYHVDVESAYDWLESHYGSKGETLYERIQNTEAYASIYAPLDIDTRYIFEDIRTGCVPFFFAGETVGVETPVIVSTILWASTIYETDFLQYGRNRALLDFDELLRDAYALKRF